MPVEYHIVHERTKSSDKTRWGCFNKPRTRNPLAVPNGVHLTYDGPGRYEATPLFKVVDDFGSLECRNDQSLTDIHCRGCCHAGSGEAYSEHIRKHGT